MIPFVHLIAYLSLFPLKECYNPGETIVVESRNKVLLVNGNPVLPFKQMLWHSLFIIPFGLLDEKVTIMEPRSSTLFQLKKCKIEFPVERLTLPPEKVFLSPENLRRALDEKKEMDTLWVHTTPRAYFHGDFLLPVTGKIKHNFGLRRIINGEERSPHTGIDIKAPEGTPVRASQAGVVVYSKETFFGGNSVIIDHGLGIYTMYFHLRESFVKEGTRVKRGEIIGTVGKTGRATGPHLHWGIRVMNKRVNPFSIMDITQRYKKIVNEILPQ